VYSELFKALAEQELSAFEPSDAAGAKNAAPPAYPSFGSSDSASAEVFGFYRAWESFVTYKDFAWADPYNPATAPNRQVCMWAFDSVSQYCLVSSDLCNAGSKAQYEAGIAGICPYDASCSIAPGLLLASVYC
jgi:hypothetical protein